MVLSSSPPIAVRETSLRKRCADPADGALYHRFGSLPAVQGALHGMMAVAAGLVLMTGIKLAQSQPRTVRGLVFGLLSLTAVGIVRLPLGWAMLVLIPSALWVEWRARR